MFERLKPWLIFMSFALAVTVLILQISNRFDKGAQRRHDICTEINNIKQILHDEHVPKLKAAQKNVKLYPKGITLKTREGDVHITYAQLVESRRDEAKIVRDTKQEPCPS